jgi:hypothetical protein
MDSFIQLSDHVGLPCIGWRYDPIFLTKQYDLEFHIRSFAHMAKRLSGHVDQCVISFIDLYEKTKRNFPEAREVRREEREILGREFAAIGQANHIQIRTCCEGTQLTKFGIDAGGCMTKEIMERAIGSTLDVPPAKKSPREQCGCLLGNDIGMYHTCSHGCVYCYANHDRQTVRQNVRLHDPASPFLIGHLRAEDKIHDAKQVTYIDGQLSFSF